MADIQWYCFIKDVTENGGVRMIRYVLHSHCIAYYWCK